MANDFSNYIGEVWSKRVQNLLKRILVATQIASTEERSNLKKGDTVHRPYSSDLYAQDYTKGTDVTMLDVDTTDETITVDTTKVVPIYIDEVDNVQSFYKIADKQTSRAAYVLRNVIDQAVLAHTKDASNSSASLITLSTSNVVSSFSNVKADLVNNGVEDEMSWCAVVDPDTISILEQYFTGNGFKVADETIRNGYKGDFLGLKFYESTNIPTTVSLGLATNVTAGDTVTINGVTFTFVASPASAGDVDIGGSVDTSAANLAAAINGGSGAGSAYIALSDADRGKLSRSNVVATAVAGDDVVNLTANKKMVLSETLTDGTDGFGDQTKHCYVGQTGAIELIMQSMVKTAIKDEPKKLGKNFLTWTLFGTGIFNEGKERIYDLKLKA